VTRVNIQLPDDLHKQLKLKALREDTTLKDLVIETLRKRSGGDV
jgi:predicted HicB family RNase H-like nuclease